MRVVTIPDTVQGTGRVLMLNMLKFADRRLDMEEYLPAFNRVMVYGVDWRQCPWLTEGLLGASCKF